MTGLSQHKFAPILGVTRTYVYYLERGEREPSNTLRLLLNCVEERHKANEKGKEK